MLKLRKIRYLNHNTSHLSENLQWLWRIVGKPFVRLPVRFVQLVRATLGSTRTNSRVKCSHGDVAGVGVNGEFEPAVQWSVVQGVLTGDRKVGVEKQLCRLWERVVFVCMQHVRRSLSSVTKRYSLCFSDILLRQSMT